MPGSRYYRESIAALEFSAVATRRICLFRDGANTPLGPEGGALGGIALELPLAPEVGADFGFPLVEDPRATDRALVLGMFVTRPLARAWQQPILTPDGAPDLGRLCQLVANVRGAEGGSLISGGNAFDAERLALHYGLVDAVLIGSGTLFAEGYSRRVGNVGPGYLWQDYTPLGWPQLADRAAVVAAGIRSTRRSWQRLGVLSSRDRPAQIVVTASGRQAADGRQVGDAAIFTARHPDGSAIEAYVLTSETGAQRLLATDGRRWRNHDDRLLVVSPPGEPDRIDLPAVPTMLRRRLDIRIANHDGGRTVLDAFVHAGAVPQLHLTIMRNRSLAEQIGQDVRLPLDLRVGLQRDLAQRCELLFPGGEIPGEYRPLQVLSDGEDAVVIAFDTRWSQSSVMNR